MAKPIYVEIAMTVPLDRLWFLTQQPDEHEKWDLRFSEIRYLPKDDPSQPQRFRYATRIGLGIVIEGTGESAGEFHADSARSSALRFESSDPRSLILEGSGYWKYIPSEGHVRFLTLYDYRTRFGAPGRVVDRLVFRPLIGWATAWSFDRLRLWVERGIDPRLSAARAMVDACARLSLAFCWCYQGLVPKLIARDPDELALTAAALPEALRANAHAVVTIAGVFEILVGLSYLLLPGRRSVFTFGLVLLVLFTAPAVITSPAIFVQSFNPMSLVAAMAGLSACGLIACRDLPSARQCVRHKPETQR